MELIIAGRRNGECRDEAVREEHERGDSGEKRLDKVKEEKEEEQMAE